MKQWHARIRIGKIYGEYGRWVPTGCTDLDAAKEYINVYYPHEGRVVEWLEL